MNDFLDACISDLGVKNDHKAFTDTFCARCRNRECVHAKWSGDKFAARVAAQPDRMFKPTAADPTNPKYARLADFVDNLREAMRLEIADRRKDWEVPEIPILDGLDVKAPPAAAVPLDDAARALARARGKDLDLPDPWAEATREFVAETERLMPADDPAPVPAEDPEPEPRPAPMVVPPPPPRNKPVPSRLGNAPDRGGVMIGGAAPATKSPADDPWEPKKKIETVQPGAKITLGGGKGE